MNELLKEIGLTAEELQRLAVQSIVTEVLDREIPDHDSVEEAVHQQCSTQITGIIDAKVAELMEGIVIPQVGQMVEDAELQQHTKWGEPKGDKLYFKEYLEQRVSGYLTEEVNREGKSKEEARRGYSSGWTAVGTRVQHAIHQHLRYTMESALESLLKDANRHFAAGIEKAFRMELEKLLKGIKFTVKVPR